MISDNIHTCLREEHKQQTQLTNKMANKTHITPITQENKHVFHMLDYDTRPPRFGFIALNMCF